MKREKASAGERGQLSRQNTGACCVLSLGWQCV